MMLQTNDILWKGVIEDLFEPLLRFFFKDADQLFDFSKGFVFLDKELETISRNPEPQHPRVVDKLVQVCSRQNAKQRFLVYLTVQEYADADFAQRMFIYYCRILDKYPRPVTILAIFLGKRGKKDVCFFEDRWLGSKLRFEYNCYYIDDQDESELRKMDNSFALVVLIALLKLRFHNDVPRLLRSVQALIRELLRRGLPADTTRLLLAFLTYYIHFDIP